MPKNLNEQFHISGIAKFGKHFLDVSNSHLVTKFTFEGLDDGVRFPAAVDHVHRDVGGSLNQLAARRRWHGHELETGRVDGGRLLNQRVRTLPLDGGPTRIAGRGNNWKG